MYNPKNEDKKNIGNQSLIKYKLVFLGDQSVGKTSIINRFIYDNFDGKDHPTVGIDFISKTIYHDDKTIRLQIWDTAGQERFRSLIPSYIRDSSIAIIVYDATNLSSFQNITRWIEYVKEERGDNVVIMIIGNKIDMIDQRKITQDEGEALAKEYKSLFAEVSAKSGMNIQSMFQAITTHLISQELKNVAEMPNNGIEANENKGISIGNAKQPTIVDSTGCC